MSYYLHQIKRSGTTVDKGIVVKDTLDAAEQGFHAYLGAYAYGQSPNVDFVHCMITDENNQVWENVQWVKPATPEVSTEA